MGLRQILLYVVGRVVSAVFVGLGVAFDYTGASFPNITNNIQVVLIAFIVFAGLTFAREIELLLQEKPKITIEPQVHKGEAFLVVHNSGASGLFRATGRIIATSVAPQLYVMYWEGLGTECTIDKDGKGAIKVAELAKLTITQGRDAQTAIFEGGIAGFKMGTSGEQIFPIRSYEEYENGDKIIGHIKDKGEVEIAITSNPPPAKSFGLHRYLLDLDDRNNLIFTEILNYDR